MKNIENVLKNLEYVYERLDDIKGDIDYFIDEMPKDIALEKLDLDELYEILRGISELRNKIVKETNIEYEKIPFEKSKETKDTDDIIITLGDCINDLDDIVFENKYSDEENVNILRELLEELESFSDKISYNYHRIEQYSELDESDFFDDSDWRKYRI